MTPENESLVAAAVQWGREDYLAVTCIHYFSRGTNRRSKPSSGMRIVFGYNARGALVGLHCFPTQGSFAPTLVGSALSPVRLAWHSQLYPSGARYNSLLSLRKRSIGSLAWR